METSYQTMFAFQTYLGKPWVISSVPVTMDGRHGRRLGTVIAAGQAKKIVAFLFLQAALTLIQFVPGVGQIIGTPIQFELKKWKSDEPIKKESWKRRSKKSKK